MTQGVRILALATDAFGGRGGIAQYNRDLFAALTAAGTAASLIVVVRAAAEDARSPARVRQLPPRRGRIAYALTAIARALTFRPKVVFCGHLFMAPLAFVAARLAGAKLIVQLHGIEAWRRPSRWRRAAVERADLVLCVSRHTRAKLLDWAALAPERALVLPDTVGRGFTPGDASRFRAARGLDGKCILLSVGRLSAQERYKGQDRVIGALPHLLAAGHDAVFLIAGEGDDRDRLEALARTLGVAERVRFLGVLDSATLADAYRAADLFVMPSSGEGFGIAFLEAMACGTRAVGLDAGGARDALADGTLGTLTTEDDLAAKLSRLLGEEKPDPRVLAAAVARRFGPEAFAAGAAGAFSRLQEAA